MWGAAFCVPREACCGPHLAPTCPVTQEPLHSLVCFSSPVGGVGGEGQIASKFLYGSAGPWALASQGGAPKRC